MKSDALNSSGRRPSGAPNSAPSPLVRGWRRSRAVLFGLTCASLAASAQANGLLPSAGLIAGGHCLPEAIKFLIALAPMTAMQIGAPIIGLLVAVASTHFLHRRRSARLEALKSDG